MKGKCPKCQRPIEIPASVTIYECVCSEVYDVKIIEEVSKP